MDRAAYRDAHTADLDPVAGRWHPDEASFSERFQPAGRGVSAA